MLEELGGGVKEIGPAAHVAIARHGYGGPRKREKERERERETSFTMMREREREREKGILRAFHIPISKALTI